jgi:hypothetical protein
MNADSIVDSLGKKRYGEANSLLGIDVYTKGMVTKFGRQSNTGRLNR